MNPWPKRIVDWTDGDTAHLSIVFTWQLPQAYSLCLWYKAQGYHVRAGGPAVRLIPEFLASVADTTGDVTALPHHNANATFTSRGCVRRCAFCAVPIIEGNLVELTDFIPRPIVCDNNLLACSRTHFERVVDRLQGQRNVDFNQGLDARLLKDYHVEGLKRLDMDVLRFAWDNISDESIVMAAIEQITQAGFARRKLRCYVLFNFKDTLETALYRCETLKGMGILPNVQRYQPLDTLRQNSHVSPDWNEHLLRDFARYWSRQVWLGHISFAQYKQRREA